jgi:kinesin family protein 3/17
MIREFQAEIEKLRAQVASGGGGSGNSAESERMVRQIEMEKAAISQQKDLAESEKARIARELEAKHQEILAEKMKAENAARQLKAIEEKLMHGGQNLLQKTEQQELELREKERKLEEERLQKRQLERKMEEMEEAALQENQKFDSIQEELENKSDKLKKLFSKYQRMKSELRDIQVEFERDKEEMLDQIRSLNREVKLKELVIRHFIPPSEMRKIESRCRYDEENDEWCLEKQHLTGNSIRRPQSASVNGKRPISAAAKAAARMGVDNPRFKSENVLTLELDMPDRTTRDYDDRGFDDGEVFSVPAIPNVYFSYPSGLSIVPPPPPPLPSFRTIGWFFSSACSPLHSPVSIALAAIIDPLSNSPERDGAFGDDQRARQRSAGSDRGGGSARPSSAARRDKPKTAQGSRPEVAAASAEE